MKPRTNIIEYDEQKRHINLTMPVEVLRQVRSVAKANRRSMSNQITVICSEYLDRQKKEGGTP